MQKLDMLTPDMVAQNMEAIAQLFPNIITEQEDADGNIIKGIDYDLFRQMFSRELVEGSEERYRLDWPGKRASILKANTPIEKTLRPVVADSVNWDTTENLYIEGDNFEVLKVLQESYLGKVKMIYIDPPYNTGKDFVYTDNYAKKREEELESIGALDEEGNKYFKPIANTDTNGRFHSDWLSMMYERLLLARDLLQDDGVIFISIDDNETHNLKKIADEVFGEDSFEANIIPIVNPGGRDYKQVAVTNEYILAYSKSEALEMNEIPKESEFTFNDSLGGYNLRELRNRNPKFHSGNRPNLFFPFYVDPNITQDGYCSVSLEKTTDYQIEVRPYNSEGKESVWRWGKIKCKDNIKLKDFDKSQILAKQKSDGNWNIYEKNRRDTTKVKSVWDESTMRTENGTRLIRSLFGVTFFDHPKPIDLIKRCIQIGSIGQDLILDFFSGSGTSAHAVMQLNAEDGENRKFIMVQIPEETDKDSEAYNAGYKNICEIGKERIRRAGKKIMEENKDKEGIEKLDIGFRVYRLDSSNMKDVFYHPTEVTQAGLFDLTSNIKDDRTPEDILAQVMLDLGLTLDLPIETRTIASSTVFLVAGNSLVACFDEEVDFSIVDEIAGLNPLKVVFRDSSFASDADRINFETRFKKLSPDSDLRVI